MGAVALNVHRHLPSLCPWTKQRKHEKMRGQQEGNVWVEANGSEVWW